MVHAVQLFKHDATVLFVVKSVELVANRIWEFCSSYDKEKKGKNEKKLQKLGWKSLTVYMIFPICISIIPEEFHR